MGCSTCGGKSTPQPAERFEVTFPDGSTRIVNSEHDARVAEVMNPGARSRKL